MSLNSWRERHLRMLPNRNLKPPRPLLYFFLQNIGNDVSRLCSLGLLVLEAIIILNLV